MLIYNSIALKSLLTFLMICTLIIANSQNDHKALEKNLANSYGIEKLILLNDLTGLYLDNDIRKSIKYGKQAVELAEKIISDDSSQIKHEKYYLKVDAYNGLGLAQYFKERYYDAKLNFESALYYGSDIGYEVGIQKAQFYLSKLDSIGVKASTLRETFGNLGVGRAIRSGSSDLALSTIIKTAETHEKNGNYYKAIKNYEKAIDYLADKGEDEEIAELYRRIAENYNLMGNIPKSLEYYKMAIGEQEKFGDSTGMEASRDSITNLQGQIVELIDPNVLKIDSAEKIANLQTLEDYKRMAAELEDNEDYEQSLEYYKLYNELNDKIIEDEKQQELALLEKSYEIERNLHDIQLLTQDKEIQELELKNKESEILQQKKFRQSIMLVLALLLALALALYLLYFNKRRDHKKLNLAHTDLQFAQDQLIKAEKKIKILLDQQLSTEVAQELISETDETKIQRKLVCVMFLDIRGFTSFAENRKPEEIIDYQNKVFGFMIDSVYKHNGIINQFLGDGFMATFGVPESKGNDSENAFLAASDIIHKVNKKSREGEIPETRIGIGLHTGKVVVGNVGTSLRKQYSITGNAVIIAARIEQLNKIYSSQLLISEEVIQNSAMDTKGLKSLGPVELKGREKPVNLFKIL
jgi:adenylate cyclase